MSINEYLLEIQKACSDFSYGDLLALSDIKDVLLSFDKEEMPANIKSVLGDILKAFESIDSMPDQEGFVKSILDCANLALSPVSDKANFDQFNFKDYIKTVDKEDDSLYENIIDEVDMLEKFYDEATEHLSGAQVVLIDLEHDSGNQESINTIFRAFHTIKGSAAFLGIKNIEEVAHVTENMLSLVRDGKLVISSQLIDVIFYSIKFLEDLVRVLPSCNYDINRIIPSYMVMNIKPLLTLVEKIVKDSETRKLGEILEELGKIDKTIVNKILTKQKEENRRFGDLLVEEEIVTDRDIEEAVTIQKKERIQSSFVKVHSSRLNDLVDIVGELVITQSMITQSTADNNRESLEKNINQLITISRSIKNVVLNMGMVPIGEIFNKLKVVIRNASRDLGRVVNVTLNGEDTELDRNLIEAIYDPLVHMVRNSVDHGIEDGEERVKKGKPDVGHIVISAIHKGSGIEITVEDDGQGIDRKKLIDKAVDKGIIKSEEAPWYLDHERESYMLLFKPGFSTKDKVSELSGRGVGLDVVKQNIERIRGKIDIQSTFDEGSKFTLKLPLTLAIIDGFVTKVGVGKYIFPFSAISEIVVPKVGQLDHLDSGEIILNNRGQFIPVFKASEIIKLAGGEVEAESTSLGLILIISHEGSNYGIGVDRVLGKQEIVIKSLNEVLMNMELFSGGSIFGDGSIGFVIDIDIFLEKCSYNEGF